MIWPPVNRDLCIENSRLQYMEFSTYPSSAILGDVIVQLHGHNINSEAIT